MKCCNCGKAIKNENNAIAVEDGFMGPVCAANTGHFSEVTSLEQIMMSPDEISSIMSDCSKEHTDFLGEMFDKYNSYSEDLYTEEEKKRYLDIKKRQTEQQSEFDTEFYSFSHSKPSTEYPVHPFLLKHLDSEDLHVMPPFASLADKKNKCSEKIVITDEDVCRREAIKHFANIFCDPAASEETWKMFLSLSPTLAVAHTIPKGFRACFSVGSNADHTNKSRLIEIKVFENMDINPKGWTIDTGEVSFIEKIGEELRIMNSFPFRMRTPSSVARIRKRSERDDDPKDQVVKEDKNLYCLMHEWFTIEKSEDMVNINSQCVFYDKEEFLGQK